jgi:hypothetical protein
MSEEEIMQGINKTLSFMKEELKAEHSCFNIKELDALNGLLDLYQKEKEKNKEAKEMLDTTPKDLVHKVFEINRAKIVNANDYIHKDKIKEKIKYCNQFDDNIHNYAIEILNDLLEGE